MGFSHDSRCSFKVPTLKTFLEHSQNMRNAQLLSEGSLWLPVRSHGYGDLPPLPGNGSETGSQKVTAPATALAAVF